MRGDVVPRGFGLAREARGHGPGAALALVGAFAVLTAGCGEASHTTSAADQAHAEGQAHASSPAAQRACARRSPKALRLELVTRIRRLARSRRADHSRLLRLARTVPPTSSRGRRLTAALYAVTRAPAARSAAYATCARQLKAAS